MPHHLPRNSRRQYAKYNVLQHTSKTTDQTMFVWSIPDFPPLTPQRDKQVFIGNSAEFAYVLAPTPDHGTANNWTRQWIFISVRREKIPVDTGQRISKIREPLAPADFVRPLMVDTRVGCHNGSILQPVVVRQSHQSARPCRICCGRCAGKRLLLSCQEICPNAWGFPPL